jgi:hypothetical protein
MGWTYNTLKDAVTNFLSADMTSSAQAFATAFPIAVRQAEERILHTTFVQPFRRTALVVGDGSQVIAQVPSLIAPIYVQYNGSPLLYKQTDWIIEVYGDGATPGDPVAYAIRQAINDQNLTEFIVAPYPPDPAQFKVSYMAKPPSLTEVNEFVDQTWISRNCENALLYGTLFHLYVYEKGEPDLLAAYKEEFEKALSLLKGISRNNMRRDEYRASLQAME